MAMNYESAPVGDVGSLNCGFGQLYAPVEPENVHVQETDVHAHSR